MRLLKDDDPDNPRERRADPPNRLLNATQLAERLGIGKKKVYDLPIPRIPVSPRRHRWLESDVDEFLNRRRAS